MKINLLGGSYKQRFKDLNSQRTINWYPVVSGNKDGDDEQNTSKVALLPFPGLQLFVTLSGRYARSFCTVKTHTQTRCFAIVDNILYEVFVDGTSTALSTLSLITIGTDPIYILANANNQIGIFSFQASYTMNLLTNAVTQITSVQFPGSIESATYADGYTFVVSGGAVYWSDLNDMTTWNSLQTFSPTFRPAATIAVMSFREEIYCFTNEQIEVFLNDGVTPFSRIPRTTLLMGLLAKKSLVVLNEGFMFLGRSFEGEASVYIIDSNYSCVDIVPFSTHWQINEKQIDLSDAYGFVQYARSGSIYYYLTVPALNNTFVYDVIQKVWLERQSTQPYTDSDGSYVQGRFRPRYYCSFNGMNLFLDSFSGKIFLEDFNYYYEDDQPIIRTRISQTYSEEMKNISLYQLEINANTGSGVITGQGSYPIVMLSKSTDGGYNFFDPKNLYLGPLGDHQYRCRKHKLGTGRAWVLKLSCSDPIPLMLQDCYVSGNISTF